MKKINCKWCGMGHPPKAGGNHWIVKSIIPARIDVRECAYHKAGEISPIAPKAAIRDWIEQDEMNATGGVHQQQRKT